MVVPKLVDIYNSLSYIAVMIQIDLHKPDFYFDCKDLTAYRQIYAICRKHGIKKNFVYAIVYRASAIDYLFLKVGMSYPCLGKKRKGSVGERLVRQLAWFPGWSTKPGTSNGNDLWFKVKPSIDDGLLPNLTKNDLTVLVWDVAKRTWGNKAIKDILSLNKWDSDAPTKWAEGELSNQHAKEYGWRPPFNDIDPANNKVYKGYLSPDAFQKCFQIS